MTPSERRLCRGWWQSFMNPFVTSKSPPKNPRHLKIFSGNIKIRFLQKILSLKKLVPLICPGDAHGPLLATRLQMMKCTDAKNIRWEVKLCAPDTVSMPCYLTTLDHAREKRFIINTKLFMFRTQVYKSICYQE